MTTVFKSREIYSGSDLLEDLGGDNSFAQTPWKTPSPIVVDACLSMHCLATGILYLHALLRVDSTENVLFLLLKLVRF
jgi:hypothetical protein